MTKQEEKNYNENFEHLLTFAYDVTTPKQKCEYCNKEFKKGTGDYDFIEEYSRCLFCDERLSNAMGDFEYTNNGEGM